MFHTEHEKFIFLKYPSVFYIHVFFTTYVVSCTNDNHEVNFYVIFLYF